MTTNYLSNAQRANFQQQIALGRLSTTATQEIFPDTRTQDQQ
ncbi:hypothetical protein [Mycobacteroides immunogenum]|nr:hypothetical protein [Mycobacteroides immunogenum]